MNWAERLRENMHGLAESLGNLLMEAFHYLALFAIIAGTIYQFASGRWKEDYPRMAFAALSVLAHLIKLVEDGVAAASPGPEMGATFRLV